MKTQTRNKLLIIFSTILLASIAKAGSIEQVANANGFKVSSRIVAAIQNASKRYNIDPLELTAIGIVETGLGKYNTSNLNHNGTVDEGIFQINTINKTYCIEYNLESTEGNAYCAAKLLWRIRKLHTDYVGRYHSNTPSKKLEYLQKITKVLELKTDK